MKFHRRLWCWAVLNPLACCLLLGIFNPVNADAAQNIDRVEVYEEAKALLRANEADAAFKLLLSYEGDWSGADTYDYLLGVAALDSGHPGEAIFSLQRLVVRKPDFAGARLELARAYFEVGDNELARTEFERIMMEDPPEQVSSVVGDYLAAIKQRARSYQSSSQFFLDIGAGHDSNPAAATADDQFLSFILDEKNVEQSSVFSELAAGVLWNKPLTPDTQLLVNGRLSHRNNPSAHFVDPSTAELGTSINWNSGANTASIAASTMLLHLDGTSNKQDSGLSLSYSRKFSTRWSIDSFVRGGAMRFDDELDIQDVDQLMFGLGLTHVGSASQSSIGIIGTEDDAKQSSSPFTNDGYGVRASSVWIRPAGRSYSLEAVFVNTEFDEVFFGSEREDDLYSVTLGTSWDKFPARGWTLTLRVTYSEKESTISLYEYDRIEAGIFLRKVFD